MRCLTIVILITLLALAGISHAAETRSLRVVAKDTATGQSGEVALYNKSYAVIIGIDNYKNLPHDRQLKNAVKDAKGVEAVLNKNYRFDKIIHLYNQEATKDRILEVLTEELPAMMGDQDSLFVFWAGHGDQEKGAQGREIGYLIPYDGEVGKIRKNLSMSELRDTVSTKLPAKHVFYVMDACYGGLLASTRSVDKKSRRDLSYLKEITRENVRQVLTAGGKGEEVLDGGPRGHSVFTGRLIEALEAAGDFITANEIQAIIKEKVYGDSRGQGKTQTPAFGILSGSGDYVFIPVMQDKLGNLAGESQARQRELELLKKAEADATSAKQKEQQEIQKKQAELDKLDKQIAEMKGRLGSGAARSSDSLDAIMAMADQKEEQGKRLEELRQQRQVEEKQRQVEIEKLKREAVVKKGGQIRADLAKYQKVASSKYAQDMAGSAWDALLVTYPEARGIARGDTEAFLLAVGLTAPVTKDKITGMEFVSVPAGCFNPDSGNKQVCLDAFHIGRFEVTQGQYKRIIGSNPSHFSSCGDDCPVENVSWNDAQQFLQKLNAQTGQKYRLPTEAEWHYACTGGGKNEEYCGGNNVDAVAWYDKNSGSKTHKVGTKQPNGLGIYDMSGNVWEWVSDWYGDSYPTGNSNPTGASSGEFRVLRGGSWGGEPENVRASLRFRYRPGSRSSSIGFRLVLPQD